MINYLISNHQTQIDFINTESLKIINKAYAESNIRNVNFDKYYQFQRKGYFKLDKNGKNLVFNRTVTLRDNWKN